MTSSSEYTRLPTDEDEDRTTEFRHPRAVALSASDKWRLVKPMIPKYMLPLCEYLPVLLQTRLLDSRLHPVKFASIWLVGILESSLQLVHQFFLVRVYD